MHGNMFPTHGNVFPTHGNVFPMHGNVFPTHGNVFPTHGNVFPTRGNVFPEGDNVFSIEMKCVFRAELCCLMNEMSLLKLKMFFRRGGTGFIKGLCGQGTACPAQRRADPIPLCGTGYEAVLYSLSR